MLFAEDEIRDDLFLLVRLVDGEDSGSDAIHLEPFVRHVHALEFAVTRARKFSAPLRLLVGLRSEKRDKNADGEMH